jgi:hypothetical protein
MITVPAAAAKQLLPKLQARWHLQNVVLKYL